MHLFTRRAVAILSLPLLVACTLPGASPGSAGGPTAVPRYVVDPYWPKPLPNRWVTGEVGGICVDKADHVFGVNRRNLTALETRVGKIPAPPVIEYDKEGNVVNAWGDADALPVSIHGCFVDHNDNVWIAGSGGGMVQEWSHDGKRMLLQIGQRTRCDGVDGKCGEPGLNASTDLLNDPADIAVDPANDDIYIADGYGNHRVVVFDAKGRFLRQWGSAGTGPSEFSPTGGGHPHCVVLGDDGLVYVCDRGNDRVEVFDKMGALQSIIPLKPGTAFSSAPDGKPGHQWIGSALDVAFSPSGQRLMFDVDTGNDTLWILDHTRPRGEVAPILGGFGSQGHNAGNFTLLHMIAVDSKGNLYTSETIDGRRVQKFVPAGELAVDRTRPLLGSPHYDPVP